MENTNAVFAICGKAMQGVGTHDKRQSLADEYGIRLIFLGHRSDIPEVCHCADIGVIPSVREGLAIAGLEMLASGIPVIGSDVKGIRDYIQNGVNGYLVTPFDVDGFSHAICKLMDADNRKALSENCLNSIAEFDSSVSYAQMERIYVEMLRNSKD